MKNVLEYLKNILFSKSESKSGGIFFFWMIFFPQKKGICNLFFLAFVPNFTPQKRRVGKNPQREEEISFQDPTPHVTHDLRRIANNRHLTHPFSFSPSFLPSFLPPYTDFRCPSPKKKKNPF